MAAEATLARLSMAAEAFVEAAAAELVATDATLEALAKALLSPANAALEAALFTELASDACALASLTRLAILVTSLEPALARLAKLVSLGYV